MYPFSTRKASHDIGGISPAEVLHILQSFPKRYQHHRAEGTYWECRLLRQGSESVTLQLIDANFERPRGPVKHSDVPLFHIHLCDDHALHYTYRWQRWKLVLVAISICVQIAAVIYEAVIFPQLSSRDILGFLLLWTSLSTLLIYWLVSNYRHDKLTLQVFKTLLEKRFPIK